MVIFNGVKWDLDKNNPDTDGDGLLDGDELYDNAERTAKGRKVAPKDPGPLKPNGPDGIWDSYVAQLESGVNPTKYSKEQSFSLGNAMRMELNVNKELEGLPEDLLVTISNGQWLRSIKESLMNPSEIAQVPHEPSFHASLRTYQENIKCVRGCIYNDHNLLKHNRIHRISAVLKLNCK